MKKLALFLMIVCMVMAAEPGILSAGDWGPAFISRDYVITTINQPGFNDQGVLVQPGVAMIKGVYSLQSKGITEALAAFGKNGYRILQGSGPILGNPTAYLVFYEPPPPHWIGP
ncbi:MAG: hypothetical protein ACYDHF_06190 [Candidatus Cryosericum sp.]